MRYAAQPQPQPPTSAGSTSGQLGTDDRGKQDKQPTAPDSSASNQHSGLAGSEQQQAGQQNGAAPLAATNGAVPSEPPTLEMLAQQDFGRCDMSSCGLGCALCAA